MGGYFIPILVSEVKNDLFHKKKEECKVSVLKYQRKFKISSSVKASNILLHRYYSEQWTLMCSANFTSGLKDFFPQLLGMQPTDSPQLFRIPGHTAQDHSFSSGSVQFSHSVVSDSLQPHGLQHTRLPCPSPTPSTYSNSCPLSR